MKNKAVVFDFSGTLVRMRPAQLLIRKETLEQLSKLYRLGIITGGSRTEVINILEKLQVKDLFPGISILTKTDSIYRKPNPKLIRLAIERLRATDVIYIGDRVTDYYMAKSANVTFIYIGKRNLGIKQLKNPNEITPEVIEELFDYI